ncbi:hypothetical protein SAMN04488529_101720 [Clostridium gasigenes]|uniref:Uncharacterized protein n=1 Tax=Clostridium gasigenes TaxID=94869 RepID=A0A1H0N8A2_9CLOT|nr:hypothetical protein SAMN04488529_101720 [Clostridium gasigenes]
MQKKKKKKKGIEIKDLIVFTTVLVNLVIAIINLILILNK